MKIFSYVHSQAMRNPEQFYIVDWTTGMCLFCSRSARTAASFYAEICTLMTDHNDCPVFIDKFKPTHVLMTWDEIHYNCNVPFSYFTNVPQRITDLAVLSFNQLRGK